MFKEKNKPLTAEQVAALSPERKLIAKIFKKHIDRAVAELGKGYDVSFQGSFATNPIRINVEIGAAKGSEIP
jgi:hypothetical protein